VTYSIHEIQRSGDAAVAVVDVTRPQLGLLGFMAIAKQAEKNADRAAESLQDAAQKADKVTTTERVKLVHEADGWKVNTGWAAEKRAADQKAADAKQYSAYLHLSEPRVKNYSGGDHFFEADVKNTGDRIITSLTYRIILLDASGKAVGEADASALPTGFSDSMLNDKPLRPNYTARVLGRIENPPADWTGKVRLEIKTLEFQKPS
jgi:hypothetical protein